VASDGDGQHADEGHGNQQHPGRDRLPDVDGAIADSVILARATAVRVAQVLHTTTVQRLA